MGGTDNKPKDEGKPETAAPAPTAPADSGPHPVDVEVQEEAAKERAEGGGYN